MNSYVLPSRANANDPDATLAAALNNLSVSLTQQVGTSRPKEVSVPKLASLDAGAFRVWRRQVVELGELNAWTDDLSDAEVQALSQEAADARERRRKRGVLQIFAALEGTAAESVAHLSTSDYTSQEGLLDALSDLAITPAGAQLAEEEFRAARQMPGDSLLQFAARVRNRFTEAFPNEKCETSREAKRQFVCSLLSKALSRELARRCPLERHTYSQLVAEAQHLYAADLMIHAHHPAKKDGAAVNALPHGGGQATRPVWNSKPDNSAGKGKKKRGGSNNRNGTGKLKNQKGEEIKCWHCQQNHYRRDCPTAPKHQKTRRNNRNQVNAVGDDDTDGGEDDESDDIICELMAYPATGAGN